MFLESLGNQLMFSNRRI